MYISKEPGIKINISLMLKEEIPKNSAIPPQTPNRDLSVDDFLNFLLSNVISPHNM